MNDLSRDPGWRKLLDFQKAVFASIVGVEQQENPDQDVVRLLASRPTVPFTEFISSGIILRRPIDSKEIPKKIYRDIRIVKTEPKLEFEDKLAIFHAWRDFNPDTFMRDRLRCHRNIRMETRRSQRRIGQKRLYASLRKGYIASVAGKEKAHV